ncbi:hypothetical protein [Nocardia carnea]|uniref:hypothetical protein n=1 Tax=Nocardia carnea TaxID=37328 RepID=UPI002457F46D|nr:hypothetical protein [Nocardia carnea]
MGRRPRRTPTPDIDAVLFDPPGTRRDPVRDCEHCAGDGWELDSAGEPLEPAVRCRCTTPAGVA